MVGMVGWHIFTDPGSLQLIGNTHTYSNSGFTMELDTRYIFKMRVETTGQGHVYSLKVWRDGDPEPSDWSMTRTESLSYDSGSLLLLANKVDASFGTVSIVPI